MGNPELKPTLRPAARSETSTVLLLLALATLVKIAWAFNSVGSCDVMLFTAFGKALSIRGMARLYIGTPSFNHTPVTGWLIEQLYLATKADHLRFAIILRLGSILADIPVVLGLLRLRKLKGRPPAWALYGFAVSPVSIMVSGFHGNIDPIMVMFLVLAAIAIVEDQPVWCGLLFAAACNIKIVPILVSPAFLFCWMARGRRPALAFMASSGGLMLAGASWPLIHCPAAFLRNVFGYGSFWGGWGISYWLRQTGLKEFDLMDFTNLTPAQNHVVLALKVITMAGVIALAWRRRKLGGVDFLATLGVVFTWIFVFAPGVGVQYMVWYAPFILFLSPRWWAALTLAATIYLARFYYSTSGFRFPWDMSFPKGPEVPYWAPWMNVVWVTFVGLLLFQIVTSTRLRTLGAGRTTGDF